MKTARLKLDTQLKIRDISKKKIAMLEMQILQIKLKKREEEEEVEDLSNGGFKSLEVDTRGCGGRSSDSPWMKKKLIITVETSAM